MGFLLYFSISMLINEVSKKETMNEKLDMCILMLQTKTRMLTLIPNNSLDIEPF